MTNNTMANEYKETKAIKLNTALYIRLSREDGDKTESLSIGNQRMLLAEFISKHEDLRLFDTYIDE